MTDLPHTHDAGGQCLACDVENIGTVLEGEGANYALDALDRVAAAFDSRVLTCVYCGHEYPQDTPAHGSEVLTEHIKACEKHPMRTLERELALTRLEADAIGSMLLDVQQDALAKGKRIAELESMTPAEFEREAIRRAIVKHRSVFKAAKAIGIGRATLYRYARHHPEVLEGTDIICSTPGENTK